LKVRRTLVSLKNPSMGCRNHKNRNSAETLETLGPQIKISRNCTQRVSGGMLKEAIHSYAKIFPKVLVEGAETSKKGEGRTFSEILEGCTFLQLGGDDLLENLCNGSSRTLL
jgi:hypothetical protein